MILMTVERKCHHQEGTALYSHVVRRDLRMAKETLTHRPIRFNFSGYQEDYDGFWVDIIQ